MSSFVVIWWMTYVIDFFIMMSKSEKMMFLLQMDGYWVQNPRSLLLGSMNPLCLLLWHG